MTHRKLTSYEIDVLIHQQCTADNWDNILVSERFDTLFVRNTRFSGRIRLGVFEDEFELPGGVKKHTGLNDVHLHNCELGDNVLISNVNNYIANYRIGTNVCIQNIHLLYVEGKATFGNGVEVAVLNETGGREVMINNRLSAHFAYIYSFYRHRPLLIQKLKKMVQDYTDNQSSEIGIIGDNVKILNSRTIRNVYIGNNATLEGVSHLENGSINSNASDPIHIGYNVMAKDFIIGSGSHIEDGTMLTRCFVGQACHLGHTYSANDSLIFSNCQGENGEACAIFAGPFTVTHHKSTLLIAGMFSFMNAGSGSNQSNHMYKLGPIHQGIVERGGKTTSNSYVLWPAKIGAFSLIMGRHYKNSDTSNMPFSYLIEKDDKSVLVPGINLRSVGTIRDAQKFPKRDKRKDPDKLDQINFNLLSPYTIQKMFRGMKVLRDLQKTCGETSATYTYQSCDISNSSLRRGLILYNIAITKFLGNSLISRLQKKGWRNIDEIRDVLKPDTEIGLLDWRDLAGLLAPRTEVDKLIEDIENDRITDIESVNTVFGKLNRDYYDLEWTWAWDKIQLYYDLSPDTITIADIIQIIEKWKDAVITLDRQIYEDARKEFSLSSRTGFGIDGNRNEVKDDFEQVRGVFEDNSFVRALIEHIDIKGQLGDDMIARLQDVE